MQDLALKASRQAEHIYKEMPATVDKVKAEYADKEKQWRAAEARHSDAVQVLRAQIAELEKQKAALNGEINTVKGREGALKTEVEPPRVAPRP